MKLPPLLLIAVSMILGVVGAVTAYLAPLDLPDRRLIGQELNAPAGIDPADPSARTPLAQRGQTLDAELLAALRQQGVRRVHLKEFDSKRWTGWPLFLFGCLGLGLGSAWVRRQAKTLHLQPAPPGRAGSIGTRAGTEGSLASLRLAIHQLQRELPSLSPSDQLRKLLHVLGEAQRHQIPALTGARAELTARLGLTGYARFMDAFAAAERQINRAWSAAADQVLPESLAALHKADALLQESAARLNVT
jgi:hypothetical protein